MPSPCPWNLLPVPYQTRHIIPLPHPPPPQNPHKPLHLIPNPPNSPLISALQKQETPQPLLQILPVPQPIDLTHIRQLRHEPTTFSPIFTRYCTCDKDPGQDSRRNVPCSNEVSEE